METMKFFELRATGQKSYYGKANVLELQNGDKFLISYRTIVCMIDRSGTVKRFWSGCTSTTIKHINDFLRFYGVPGGGAAWWRRLPVENVREYVRQDIEYYYTNMPKFTTTYY